MHPFGRRTAKKMSHAKRKWHCPYCSQDSPQHWNLKIHIKRRHSGIGEPIDDDEDKEFRDRKGYQFFSYNHPYGVNDLSLGSQQGRKEKEQDMIEVIYQIVIEQKEKLRKIKEIKSFSVNFLLFLLLLSNNLILLLVLNRLPS
jgi:hypothetical protein